GQPVWPAPWLILLICLAAFRGHAMNRLLSTQWVTTIGGMCYSIYLLHDYTMAALGLATQSISPGAVFLVRLIIQFLIITPAVLAISALYFRFVERPCMRPDWPL